jgi:hypothetical protein
VTATCTCGIYDAVTPGFPVCNNPMRSNVFRSKQHLRNGHLSHSVAPFGSSGGSQANKNIDSSGEASACGRGAAKCRETKALASGCPGPVSRELGRCASSREVSHARCSKEVETGAAQTVAYDSDHFGGSSRQARSARPTTCPSRKRGQPRARQALSSVSR